MESNKPTSIRLTDEDERIIGELRTRTGIMSKSDLVRHALKKLHDAECGSKAVTT